ncbi:MAG TPA: immunoglobulin domain-containing protein [Verrucomicrobiae bacterium]|nr:immunoglobulin domain-containing protein [Verrucomicrobiae bacterium]
MTAATILPSTNDLWDISQGSVVTGTTGVYLTSDIRDMFGGTFSQTEPGHTIFNDGAPVGFVHLVEWQTLGPVTISSFALFAAGDGPAANNSREFAQFVLKAKSSASATDYDLTLYTLVVTNHPYVFVDPVNYALVSTNITPVTAQFFQAQITERYAGYGYDGPRIIELDGFGVNPPVIITQPANQTFALGANATFAVTTTGSTPLSYQWVVNGSNMLAMATNATLVLTNLQLSQSGNNYSVVVSNSFGVTNSSSAMLTVIPPVVPSTGDLWDISQGSVVTGSSEVNQGGSNHYVSDIRDMFGGQFGLFEPGHTLFADGLPAGFVHYVEWQTPGPVSVSSFTLFAAGNGPAANNAREFAQFVLKAKSSALATNYDLTLYTLVVTNHPYNYLDPGNFAVVATNITAVTAQYFRAEFTQYAALSGSDGPRIIELDGFGSNALTIVTQPSNQTVTAGASETFAVGATGTGPLSFQWQLNGMNISPAANPTATNFMLVLTNVQMNLSGNQYSVVVSNLLGSTNSSSALLTVVPPQVHYVDLNSTNPVPPFSSWATAATNIQDAVDAAPAGDEVLVTNGIYQFGGRTVPGSILTNRLIVTNILTVKSVNGPAVTAIMGNQVLGPAFGDTTVRCVYLDNGATLAGFTLTNGASGVSGPVLNVSDLSGGGVWSGSMNTTVSNCVIVGNTATALGGGAYSGTFVNCTLSGNSADTGGGAANASLINCLVTNNATIFSIEEGFNSISFGCGGGVSGCTLQNCLIIGNSAINPPNNFQKGGGAFESVMDSCTLTSNTADMGGGAGWQCILNNCTLNSNYISGILGGGGGAFRSVLNNCVLNGNSGCASYLNTMNNCTLIGSFGGASYQDIMTNCTLAGNFAYNGGAAYQSTLNFCNLTGNFATNQGGGAYQSTLNNCIVSGNIASSVGGGAYMGMLNNCIISGNTAGAGDGGVLAGVLNNCLIISNSTPSLGFGAAAGESGGTNNNCTIAFNSGGSVGGIRGGILNNCLIYSNTGSIALNYQLGTFNFCSTTPLPTNGTGNITNNPLFVNPAAGDFHLQSNSPCINAGHNAYVTTNVDLDGNPRISGGTVDIGAYEFQNPASIISYAWLQQYNLPTDGSADFLDPDHDGLNNWQEWIAGTDPTNPSSVLLMLSPTSTNNPPGLIVTWQSAPNINYYLQRATNLSIQPSFQPLATNLPGQAGTTSYTDTNAPAPGPYFYRVGVQHP